MARWPLLSITQRGWCPRTVGVLSQLLGDVTQVRHIGRTQQRWILSQAIEDRLVAMRARHDEILGELRSGGSPANMGAGELSSLTRAMKLMDQRDELNEEEKQLKDLLEESAGVAEMEQECMDELKRNSDNRTQLEKKMLDAILPHEEEDYTGDAILEIRAGAGGDEASYFAYELYEGYERIAKSIGFKVERLDESHSEVGGLSKGSLLLTGGAIFKLPTETEEDDDDSDPLLFGPYGAFKFESGVHRVQRVRRKKVLVRQSSSFSTTLA